MSAKTIAIPIMDGITEREFLEEVAIYRISRATMTSEDWMRVATAAERHGFPALAQDLLNKALESEVNA